MSAPAPPADRGTDAHPAPTPSPPHALGELWAEDGTSRAEIRVAGGHLEVTLALPDVDPARLEHFVGSNLLLLWSAEDPETQRTMVRLPVDVRPDTSVARVNNGVFDLTVLLSESADTASDPSPESQPDGSA